MFNIFLHISKIIQTLLLLYISFSFNRITKNANLKYVIFHLDCDNIQILIEKILEI